MLDALAEASNRVFTTARYGDVAELKHKGRTLILLKPSTLHEPFGQSRPLLDGGREDRPENLLVVSDDIAAAVRHAAYASPGSAGGHNGLKNIAELLERRTTPGCASAWAGFPQGPPGRLCAGGVVGRGAARRSERLKVFGDAILSFTTIGLERTMNFFNKK